MHLPLDCLLFQTRLQSVLEALEKAERPSHTTLELIVQLTQRFQWLRETIRNAKTLERVMLLSRIDRQLQEFHLDLDEISLMIKHFPSYPQEEDTTSTINDNDALMRYQLMIH